MSTRPPSEDRKLVRSALAALSNDLESAELDHNLVAAWQEGRLDEAAAAEVEARLAAEPALLAALLIAREVTTAGMPVPASPAEIGTARSLVRLPWWQRLLPDMADFRWTLGPTLAATFLFALLGSGAFAIGADLASLSSSRQAAALTILFDDGLGEG
jgi:hypothetical protein